MSPCDTCPPGLSTEGARIRVGTALAHLEVVAQMLEALPPPETALAQGDRALFRYLQAAGTAKSWVVGHEAGDSVDRPARGSALGDGQRIYGWDETETARQYESAMRDWSERQ